MATLSDRSDGVSPPVPILTVTPAYYSYRALITTTERAFRSSTNAPQSAFWRVQSRRLLGLPFTVVRLALGFQQTCGGNALTCCVLRFVEQTPPELHRQNHHIGIWCWLTELNRRHPAYKAGALPAELNQRILATLSQWSALMPLSP